MVNGNLAGTIPYSDTVQTTTITDINVDGNVTVVIEDNNSGDARVGMDNLSWTCYSSLSLPENSIEAISIYPNPVKNSLNIKLNSQTETQIDIFNVLGKHVLSKVITNSSTINTEQLSTGVYILRIKQGNSTLSKKLIKN